MKRYAPCWFYITPRLLLRRLLNMTCKTPAANFMTFCSSTRHCPSGNIIGWQWTCPVICLSLHNSTPSPSLDPVCRHSRSHSNWSWRWNKAFVRFGRWAARLRDVLCRKWQRWSFHDAKCVVFFLKERSWIIASRDINL